MDSFSKLRYSKVWILAKYGKLNSNESQPQWEIIDSKSCGDPITLTLTSTNCLIIQSENKIHEYINLWNARENFKGTFKGNSFLLCHKMKSFMRKFRVQFLTHDGISAEQNCEFCLKELARFIDINPHNDLNSSNQNNSLPLDSLSSDSTFFVDSSNTQLPASQFGINSLTAKIGSEDLTLKGLTKILVERSEGTLPLFYQQQNIAPEGVGELVKLCLLDPEFPKFVADVEKEITKVLRDELNATRC